MEGQFSEPDIHRCLMELAGIPRTCKDGNGNEFSYQTIESGTDINNSGEDLRLSRMGRPRGERYNFKREAVTLHTPADRPCHRFKS